MNVALQGSYDHTYVEPPGLATEESLLGKAIIGRSALGFRFRWCKEAREEYETAKRRPDGSVLMGQILYLLKKLRAGQRIELTRTHLPIRSAPLSPESQWSILYTGEDGDYVGLMLIQCAVDKLPASAYELAQERLANVQF